MDETQALCTLLVSGLLGAFKELIDLGTGAVKLRAFDQE